MSNHLLRTRKAEGHRFVGELAIDHLYPTHESLRGFELRLDEFLAADPDHASVFAYRGQRLEFLSSELLPATPVARLLVFGNPCARSLAQNVVFGDETSGALHRVWRVLLEVGAIDSRGKNLPDAQTCNKLILSGVGRDSSRLGTTSFFSMPSPTSEPQWSGVAGLRRLLGAAAFRQYERAELDRFMAALHTRLAPRGKLLVFQADAFRAITGKATALDPAEIHRMPPTRHMFSREMRNRLNTLLCN